MSLEIAQSVLSHKSKSFALAAKLLPKAARDDAAILYAYCRRADDAVDEEGDARARADAVERLARELSAIYAGDALADPLLTAFQDLVRRRNIPEEYPCALLEGLRTDLGPVQLATSEELIVYSYRVAGVVGLMMCHVTGLSDPRALTNAVHLGIAMQLTNICRDVEEDFERGRLYLPATLLAECGAIGLDVELSSTLAPSAAELAPHRMALSRVLDRLLALADRYYVSGDAGIPALPWRAALAVRAARLVYSAIGSEIRRQGCDVLAPRAVVSAWRKLALLARAAVTEFALRFVSLAARRPSVSQRGESHGDSISLRV
jgi:phytoene synthase